MAMPRAPPPPAPIDGVERVEVVERVLGRVDVAVVAAPLVAGEAETGWTRRAAVGLGEHVDLDEELAVAVLEVELGRACRWGCRRSRPGSPRSARRRCPPGTGVRSGPGPGRTRWRRARQGTGRRGAHPRPRPGATPAGRRSGAGAAAGCGRRRRSPSSQTGRDATDARGDLRRPSCRRRPERRWRPGRWGHGRPRSATSRRRPSGPSSRRPRGRRRPRRRSGGP